MAMPTVTEETTLAVLDKMTKDASDPCTWTLENAESFIKEQPNLFLTVIENIKQLYPDGEGGEVQASKSLYLAMITYKLIKAAVESEELNNLFGENE
tara:strand:- start:540 stop:830 length:291 start_codon:yes stop_codon:yes gene_type:complete